MTASTVVNDLARVPDELKQRKQWVVWRREGSKSTKVPYEVTPQDSVESAGFSALVCAKSSITPIWSHLAHHNGV
jgi:hypothetical protein